MGGGFGLQISGRTLAEPFHVGATARRAHVDLEDGGGALAVRRVLERDAALERRGQEGVLAAAAHVVLVRVPEGVGQHAAREPTVHGPALRELRALDDA